MKALTPRHPSLPPVHRALAQWITANPMAGTADIARHFGTSPTWVASVISTDAFRAYMAEVAEELMETVYAPLETKIEGVASIALERLGSAVADSEDPEFILKVADKALSRLGHGKTPAAPTVNVHGTGTQVAVVSQDVLARARERIAGTMELMETSTAPVDVTKLESSA